MGPPLDPLRSDRDFTIGSGVSASHSDRVPGSRRVEATFSDMAPPIPGAMSAADGSKHEVQQTLPPLEYPAHFETRYLSYNGGIRWKSAWVHVSIENAHVKMTLKRASRIDSESTWSATISGPPC
ncbi:MAG TPA: hypothetical protein VMM84_00030 [Pyrinomonadaceae bacterium]|nr:hypothetical protein [Pyrinomonadaceae bacterium]